MKRLSGSTVYLSAGLAVLTIRLARKDTPEQVLVVVAAAGSFAALSFVFTSPIIAAILLIEATGIGGPRVPLVLVPGLLTAGIGTLVSIGLGSFTGLSTSAYALGPLALPEFASPRVADFAWTFALAIVVALVTVVVMRGGQMTDRVVAPRPFLLLPLLGLVIAGLAIAFSQTTDKGVDEVLFSGQDQLPGLIAHAGTWSLSALALLIVFKGVAYSISLGSFRGGPTFPAIFLGAAGGIMASHLAGFSITPAVAVGMSAAFVAVLRLPLSAVVVTAEPLVIVGTVVAYLVTLLISSGWTAKPATANGGDKESQTAAT